MPSFQVFRFSGHRNGDKTDHYKDIRKLTAFLDLVGMARYGKHMDVKGDKM